MNTHDLQQVRAGFHDTALGSQAVFRSALRALSHPGRLIELPRVAELPRHGFGAAALLLLALLDSDCTLWISPSLAKTDAAAWLRFHTGCIPVDTPAAARFLWVGLGDATPCLADLPLGSDDYPDQSATCVIEVQALSGGDSADLPWTLTGPGIAGECSLGVRGLPDDFESQWDRNHASFPRGVDLFLATPTHIAGLPRTTRVAHPVEA